MIHDLFWTEDRSMSPLTGLACLVASVPTVFTVG